MFTSLLDLGNNKKGVNMIPCRRNWSFTTISYYNRLVNAYNHRINTISEYYNILITLYIN